MSPSQNHNENQNHREEEVIRLQQERKENATKELIRLQEAIDPYIVPRRQVQKSTEGKWGTASSLSQSEKDTQ